MQNLLDTLNTAITRADHTTHPVKRALLINRVLEIQKNKRAIQHKLLRADWFIVVNRPSEKSDAENMFIYSCLSNCFAA